VREALVDVGGDSVEHSRDRSGYDVGAEPRKLPLLLLTDSNGASPCFYGLAEEATRVAMALACQLCLNTAVVTDLLDQCKVATKVPSEQLRSLSAYVGRVPPWEEHHDLDDPADAGHGRVPLTSAFKFEVTTSRCNFRVFSLHAPHRHGGYISADAEDCRDDINH
jgi:hypothetical protein